MVSWVKKFEEALVLNVFLWKKAWKGKGKTSIRGAGQGNLNWQEKLGSKIN